MSARCIKRTLLAAEMRRKTKPEYQDDAAVIPRSIFDVNSIVFSMIGMR
jgi:hypothetical protein